MNFRDETDGTAVGFPAVILHLGAHRTGSTRLQTILDMNRDVLAEDGLAVLTPPRPGKRITPTIRDVIAALPRQRQTRFGRFRNIRKARVIFSNLIAGSAPHPAPGRSIVSDENLLSDPFDLSGAGLYPSAYPRLSAFRELLGCPPCEIHLTTRSYDTFLVSAYAMMAVYKGGMPPFDDIRNTLLAVRRGWTDLAADVTRVFPETPLRVTSTEHDPMEDRVRDLVGPGLFAKFKLEGDKRPNVAPTEEAILAAGGLRGWLSGHDIVARYADGTRFDPLTKEERVCLAQRYAEDVARLRLSTKPPDYRR